MTVAKGDSHQTNPWVVCAHWLRGQTLVCDIREFMNIQGGHLGPKVTNLRHSFLHLPLRRTEAIQL